MGMDKSPFTLTPAAASRICELVAAEPDKIGLRLSVEGGGCSGFQYAFELEKSADSNDCRIELNGALLLIDSTSLDLLKGSSLDYVSELSGSYFHVANPNVASRCGCGNSFSL